MDSDQDDDKIASQRRTGKDPQSLKITKSGGSIIDITYTPDVAVWTKAVGRGGADRVKEPSKIQSITTKSTTDQKLVDPANKDEVAASMENGEVPLTDEANISKNKDAN